MAPKKKRDASPTPKGKAKAESKPSAKAKAAAEPKEDPEALLKIEAKEMWERYKEDGAEEGAPEKVKLKQFAECIRNMNIKKCNLWSDDKIGEIIKGHWKNCGGFSTRELLEADFLKWWPIFMAEVATRKEEVAAEEAVREAKQAAEAAEKGSRYASDGLWRIPFGSLKEALDEAHKKGKTPLIVDNTEGARTETFFAYSGAHIIEGKKMVVDKAKGATKEEVLEEVRQTFFRAKCFKYGQTVVFRLANSAPDFKGVFSNEDFPTLSLFDCAEVKKVLGLENADNFKGSPFYKMCPDGDERNEPTYSGVNEKFRVIVLTVFQEEDYHKFLEPMIPLELMQHIKVEIE